MVAPLQLTLLGEFGVVALDTSLGFLSVATWSTMGSRLRRVFSTPEKARVLNVSFGVTLVLLAIWMVIQ